MEIQLGCLRDTGFVEVDCYWKSPQSGCQTRFDSPYGYCAAPGYLRGHLRYYYSASQLLTPHLELIALCTSTSLILK